ncbi:SDR family oxidoreductase [Undibacterium crateris]|uniref:SDR family oxidoreductase n=1 Tax=Undibacterium crateris TaxID=2528175 RepID=UPI001389D8BE|nr:SDR family oxidoreductase [Undibacterium crateris]NDI87582.1 NAD-dependent epimerase/dehydratase family protein [Undibacterium crateris]
MKILVCGANGFIGRHLCLQLQAAGHQILRGIRPGDPAACPGPDEVWMDFSSETQASIWTSRLQQAGPIDVIINAIGILHESGKQTFETIHRDAPIAMYQAAQRLGITHIVQISALGGNQDVQIHEGMSPYLRTKRETDRFLLQSGLCALILRPSLIVGVDGISSRFFRMLASLPVLPVPGDGQQRLQPVHVDDLCEAVVRWLSTPTCKTLELNVVGPSAMTYTEMLINYRELMGLRPGRVLCIPLWLMHTVAGLARFFPQQVLSRDSLRMLENHNVAEPAPLQQLLARPSRNKESWFPQIPCTMLASEALLSWHLICYRYILALIWIITAVLSFGLYPLQDSLQLLQALPVPVSLHLPLLYGAASLDGMLGIACVFAPSRKLWTFQLALIATYSILIALYLPQFWLHPFGPVLKNIAIVALLLSLLSTDRKTS